MAILSLTCLDEDVLVKEFIAYNATPVNAIRKGIRFVPMFDSSGNRDFDYQFASLLVRVSIKELTN